MTFGVVKGCSFACSVVRRIAQYVADLLEPEDKDKLYDNLLVGQSKVSGLSLGLAIEYSTESGYRKDFYPPSNHDKILNICQFGNKLALL